MYGHSLDVLHLNGTHLRWQSNVPLALQRVVDPHSPLWVWSTDRGHLGGPWNFGDSSILFSPPHWKHAPPGVSSDQSSSWPLTNAILHLVWGLPFGLQPNWWHAFQLGLAQQQHMHTFLFPGHPQPWQGHFLLPSRQHIRLLHPGWIAQPLGQDEWSFNSVHLPLYYLALSGILTGNWILLGLQPIGDQ